MNYERVLNRIVTNQELVVCYLGPPDKVVGDNYMYYSPFRNKERTPSFCVNDKKGIHDFGTGKHYRKVEFVSLLLEISEREAFYRIIKNIKWKTVGNMSIEK